MAPQEAFFILFSSLHINLSLHPSFIHFLSLPLSSSMIPPSFLPLSFFLSLRQSLPHSEPSCSLFSPVLTSSLLRFLNLPLLLAFLLFHLHPTSFLSLPALPSLYASQPTSFILPFFISFPIIPFPLWSFFPFRLNLTSILYPLSFPLSIFPCLPSTFISPIPFSF